MKSRLRALLAAPLIAFAVPALAAAPAAQPAPVSALVKAVDIPFEQFTLPNGLRVVVHTDRKAPIVAVSVWYHIGSKDEPAGKTGFAHLFEHIMFNGSENNPGEYFTPLENVGATDSNGTTWFDRTNYFQNVPTPALPLALFLESDRMGYLLGAVTQKTLDNQIGVVQNEKRQGDNEPYGLTEYAILEGLFPEGHPYRHSTIGSMADLSAASLDDVKNWFRLNYGPNNAVLVLAGDIDAKTARPLVEKYFGAIPRGPVPQRIKAGVPVRTETTRETMTDKVANARLYRVWAVPGRLDPVVADLNVAAAVLGSGTSSRLYNDLVRDKRLAVGVRASVQDLELASMFQIEVDVRPGVDPATVEARLDELLAGFLKDGPTADEVSRIATRSVAGTIRGLEAIGGFGGKATALAEGALYAGDAGWYKTELARYANATPAGVRAAANRWIARGDYRLTVLPGERTARDVAAPAGAKVAADRSEAPQPAKATETTKRTAPEVTGFPTLDFPDVERATLTNGVVVTLAHRSTVPVVQMSLSFDAGISADSREKPGTQNLMTALIDEGTATRSSREIVEEIERLGAGIGTGSTIDRTRISLNALKPNLAASLDLFADIVKNPSFPPAELERLRGITLARIAQEGTQPQALALRTLPPLLYGAAHPYGVPFTGSGTAEGVKAVTRNDLVAFHRRWIRPDNARLFVVGDITMAELKPLLEARLGGWTAPAEPKGTKSFPAVTGLASRVIVLDRPGSPQSLILAGYPLPVKGTDDPLPLYVANDILGGNFSSRLNADLREEKSWSYGVGTVVNTVRDQMLFLLIAPVQTDRTGDSIEALKQGFADFRGPKPPTPEEIERTINNNVRSLPGSFETAGDVLGSIERNYVLNRPDSYQETLAGRYRALTAADLEKASAAWLDPGKLVWIVVGDRKAVEPQLSKLGLPVEYR